MRRRIPSTYAIITIVSYEQKEEGERRRAYKKRIKEKYLKLVGLGENALTVHPMGWHSPNTYAAMVFSVYAQKKKGETRVAYIQRIKEKYLKKLGLATASVLVIGWKGNEGRNLNKIP